MTLALVERPLVVSPPQASAADPPRAPRHASRDPRRTDDDLACPA